MDTAHARTPDRSPIRAANLAVRFLLELGALVAVGYWGFRSAPGIVGVGLAIALPLLVAAVWGAFVAPKAPMRLRDPAKLALELVIFGGATAALYLSGLAVPAAVFGVATLVSLGLMFAWDQRDN